MTTKIKQIKQIVGLTIITGIIVSCSSYKRVGNLTMISTRNVDSKSDYKLIQKNVEAKAKLKNEDALQMAIDEAVKKFPEGEFMKNVSVYIKSNGKKVKVVGDIWGIPSVEKSITTTVTEKIEFKVGDNVVFKSKLGKLTDGKILGLNTGSAIVEHENTFGKLTKTEIKYEELTKVK
jgi:ribosomal protein S20